MTRTAPQFLRYLACGGTGVGVDYATFLALGAVGLHYQAANIAGYALGTLVSFLLNRLLTFKIHDQVGRRLALFFAVAGIGWAASALLLLLLVGWAGLDEALAKAATLPMVAILQFTLNRRITFRAVPVETTAP